MSQRRARIQIGPGGVIYVLVTAMILAAAIYTQANLLFWSFGLMIGGLCVSLLLACQMLHGVQVQRLLPGHGVAGEPMVLRYHVTNRSWLPVFSMVIVETWGKGRRGWKKTGPVAQRPQALRGRPYGWVLHLGPHQAIQAEAPCWPLRRGTLHFERVVISSTFPFGVIRKVVEFHMPASVLVYPHLYRMNRRMLYTLSNFDPSGRKHIERGGGTEDFYGLRSYRVGDSLKMVDWKRTARTGDLVSRELTQPSPPRILVQLDLRPTDDEAAAARAHAATNGHRNGRARLRRRKRRDEGLDPSPEAQALERAISLTASLICEGHFNGYQVGLTVAGISFTALPVHHSLPHRTRMLEALAQLDCSQRSATVDAMVGHPSIIVWPGSGETTRAQSRGQIATVLGAADMDRYVLEAEGGVAGLLGTRSRPRTRREEIQSE